MWKGLNTIPALFNKHSGFRLQDCRNLVKLNISLLLPSTTSCTIDAVNIELELYKGKERKRFHRTLESGLWLYQSEAPVERKRGKSPVTQSFYPVLDHVTKNTCEAFWPIIWLQLPLYRTKGVIWNPGLLVLHFKGIQTKNTIFGNLVALAINTFWHFLNTKSSLMYLKKYQIQCDDVYYEHNMLNGTAFSV